MNKKIIITGASGGIGRALVEALSNEASLLILQARSHYAELDEWSEKFRENGTQIRVFRADFARSEEVNAFLDFALQSEPDVPIRSLINAAGVDLMSESLRKMTFEDRLEKLLSVDLKAAVFLSRHIGKELLKNGKLQGTSGELSDPRTILFLGWSGVDRGMEGETAQLYSLAKGGLIAFMRSLAQELAPSVRVCSVSPGWIRTTWGKQASEHSLKRGISESLAERWGESHEVANLIRFLLSKEATFLNGQDFRIDGGYNYRCR